MKITDYPHIKLGLSEVSHQTMRFSQADQAQNFSHRREFLAGQGLDIHKTIFANLAHKNNVCSVKKDNAGQVIKKVDGLITDEKNLALALTVADCLPVYFYDPVTETIGLIHAGWRGLVKGILPEAVVKFQHEHGSIPADLIVYIGPHIQVCHFEVQADVLKLFNPPSRSASADEKAWLIPEVYPGKLGPDLALGSIPFIEKYWQKRDNKDFIDLSVMAKDQLTAVGIKEINLEISSICTYCRSDKYFSARREQSKKPQVMLAYILQK